MGTVTSIGTTHGEATSTEFLIVTGLSGAGRSQAANTLEDLGWFVVDNLPPSLIPKVAELAGPGGASPRTAMVVGTTHDANEVLDALGELRQMGARVRVLYLEASVEVLVRRYEDTRRRHPQVREGESLTVAIEREIEMLEGVRGEADLVISTTELNVHDLRKRIVEYFGDSSTDQLMKTTITSFGYKHGLPRDVDLVLDCRFLPNPHWVEELRPLTGLDRPVSDYVLGQPTTREFLRRLDQLLDLLVPAYIREGKSYLTIAMGCTGGRHRSVALAEEVARRLRIRGYRLGVQHRDVARGSTSSPSTTQTTGD
ncbi:MAG: RNase adapter RapZ [Actinomycetia bacterium]|nr:RNase adapter RapZ [Actinomycetes bacterium]